MREKIIANSCFQHPAKHITTWTQKRIDTDTKTAINIYNQIDYIILDQNQKQSITDARAYGGTETSSDHKLVVARIEIKWPKLYYKRPPTSRQQKFEIRNLIDNKDVQNNYKENIVQAIQSVKENPNQEIISTHKWDELKDIIKSVAENLIGYKKKTSKQNIPDVQLENMSKEQKNLRLRIERTNNTEKIKEMKKSRKTILKNMSRRVKELKERTAEEMIKTIETAKNDTRMFKAVKALHTKHKKVQFVHDEQTRCVTQPQEIYNIVEKHFMNHFVKSNVNEIKKFLTPPKKLNRMITTDEVTKAVKQMANNKAPGKDNINVELIKYAPKELHKEISKILNDIFTNNDNEIQLGNGILLPIPKPKKIQGPVKNLRPITLLEVIRKILSKIFMNRIDEKINKHISQTQSAYRKNRSTTDIVWAHRWITAKTQIQDITVYITGIDMSTAFDTIDREKIIKIAEQIIDEDESRILRILLAETTLEVNIDKAQATPFKSNIGSPQGDSISGPLFTIYLNNVLQQLNNNMEREIIDVRDINLQWVERKNSNIPRRMEYADDCDFITELEKEKVKTYDNARNILEKNNLMMNEDKTEHTTIKRGTKEEEAEWRNIIKLGSKIGDRQDIERRKELSNIALSNNEKIWKKKWKIKLKTRLRLYETLVKNILLYNCGTWGISISDERKINSFHRRQLRRIIGIKWPHKISNKKLYKRTESKPISITITERRWKLLGHIMRLPATCPARKAMRYYFEVRTNKKYRGRRRTTIVTTINRDIKRTREKYTKFPVTPLISHVSLQNIHTKAKNRTLWSKIVDQVVNSAYSC